MPDLETYLTIPEVAARLRVSDETVYRMIVAGTLRAGKVGRQWRIKESDVERMWQDGQRAQG